MLLGLNVIGECDGVGCEFVWCGDFGEFEFGVYDCVLYGFDCCCEWCWYLGVCCGFGYVCRLWFFLGYCCVLCCFCGGIDWGSGKGRMGNVVVEFCWRWCWCLFFD